MNEGRLISIANLTTETINTGVGGFQSPGNSERKHGHSSWPTKQVGFNCASVIKLAGIGTVLEGKVNSSFGGQIDSRRDQF